MIIGFIRKRYSEYCNTAFSNLALALQITKPRPITSTSTIGYCLQIVPIKPVFCNANESNVNYALTGSNEHVPIDCCAT